jgi:hypothetical protein
MDELVGGLIVVEFFATPFSMWVTIIFIYNYSIFNFTTLFESPKIDLQTKFRLTVSYVPLKH